MEMDELIEALARKDFKRANLFATQQISACGVGLASVLELAVALGQTGSVRTLLEDQPCSENGALNPVYVSRALPLACRFPEEDTALCMAAALLEHRAGCHQRKGEMCENCNPSLLVASASGHTRVIRLLIENCKAANCSNQKGTALYYAALHGRREAIKLLLEYGALVDQERVAGNPLAIAAKNGHTDIIELLCEGGSPTDNAKGFALVEAAGYGQCGAVDLLCRLGADPNFVAGFSTALIEAARQGHKDVIHTLCASGADVNLIPPCTGYSLYFCATSALHEAASHSRGGGVEVLCANGADVNLIVNNKTALFLAASEGHADAIDVLCAYGADVDFVSTLWTAGDDPRALTLDGGATALMIACCEGYPRAVTRLLKNGCNVNFKNSSGNTALHCSSYSPKTGLSSVFKDYPSIVEQLLSQPECDCSVVNALGRTPLDQAVSGICGLWHPYPYVKIAQMLVKAGSSQPANDEDYVALLFSLVATHKCGFECELQTELVECIKLMLLAGWPVTKSTRQLMSRSDLKEYLMASFVFDCVTRAHDRPPSLQHLCKFVIRKELRKPLKQHTAGTGLPQSLQKFVLLQLP